MSHRVQQIAERAALLIGQQVEDKGTHVYVHRRLTLDPEQDETSSISVDYGEDRPLTENTQFIDSQFVLSVTAIVAHPVESELREQLLELRRDAHIALMADVTLGLSFVIVTSYAGALEPVISANDGEVESGELTSNWLVAYRMNRTDPGD